MLQLICSTGKKTIIFLFILPFVFSFFHSCKNQKTKIKDGTTISEKTEIDTRTGYFPKKVISLKGLKYSEKRWVFVLAGQSNMAGRGLVSPQDTVSSKKVMTINAQGSIILAKEPLHFYEPKLSGLDCGLSFGKSLLSKIPDSIEILLIPTAVGGSSVSKWLNDSVHRNVPLLSNFKQKLLLGKQFGPLKGILWHQGESDGNEIDIPFYKERLSALFRKFREISNEDNLPILVGELGSYSKSPKKWEQINQQIHALASKDRNIFVIKTLDLSDKGDKLHFDSNSQRKIGQRFAESYLKLIDE